MNNGSPAAPHPPPGTLATLVAATRPFVRRIALTLVLLLLSKFAFVAVPWALKRIVDLFSAPAALTALPVFVLLTYALLRFLGALFGELRDLVFARVGQQAVADMMLRAFDHLHALGARFHSGRQTGAVVRDVERGTHAMGFLLGAGVMSVVPTIVEIVTIVIIMAVAYPAMFTGVILATFIGYAVVTATLTERRVALQRQRVELDNIANNRLVDSLLNHETVKAHANEQFESRRLGEVLVQRREVGVRTQGALSLLHLGQSTVIALGVAGVMLLAGQRVMTGTLTVGDLVLINAYVIQICLPLNMLGFVFREVRDALVNTERMFSLLAQPPEIGEGAGVPPLQVRQGEVRFESVQFGYDRARQVLWDVGFTIPPGRTLAVVGGSGSGKSTLARLLLRYYDPSTGRVTIDGQDLRSVSQHSLRNHIGMVPQDTVLFNDTIAYNIGYGRTGASMAEVVAAAQAAYVHDFIMGLPEQYETRVGERGLKLSGGEKQRIAIARAILRDPPILILDEATSALDTRSERAIQSELERIARNRTTLIIAHRLSTVVDADEILVLERGHVVERGRHQALIAAQGIYAQMWALQQQQGELERTEERASTFPVNLASVLADVVEALRGELDARGITLYTAIDARSTRVDADPTALQKVLWQLATQTADAATPGGRLELQLTRTDASARISISGTPGERPAPAGAEALLRLNTRPADPLRTRSIIEANRGRFQAAHNGGLPLYRIDLPVQAVSTAGVRARHAPPANALRALRALVIDDQPTAREAVAHALEAYGAAVERLGSGATALDVLRRRAPTAWPDLLICDLLLGENDEDGYQVLRKLRALEEERGTPLERRLPAIALTGHSGVESRVEALLAGFQLHLVKPVDPLELAAAVAGLANRRVPAAAS